MLRKTAIGVIALASAGLLAACGAGGGAGGAGDKGPGTQSLTVGIPPVVEIGNLYTAESMGFFARQGISVKIDDLNGGAALVPALEAGAAQIGQSNIVSVLQAQQQNVDMKCFAAGYRSPPAAAGDELSLVVSPKDAGSVDSPSGLAGKTIAVNSLGNSNQLISEAYLARYGVSPSSLHFIALAYPDMPAALSSGRVTAAITDEPFTTIVKTQGARVLAAQPDAVIAPSPVYACWVASAGWLAAHRQVAAKFVTALDEADSYMAAHPGYLASILPKYTTVTASLAGRVTPPDFTTGITAADVEPWAEAAARFGITRSVISPSSVITSITP
jgi:NitT/TauT family transport system substrate-binding protein